MFRSQVGWSKEWNNFQFSLAESCSVEKLLYPFAMNNGNQKITRHIGKISLTIFSKGNWHVLENCLFCKYKPSYEWRLPGSLQKGTTLRHTATVLTWFCLSAGTPQHVPEIWRSSSKVWLLPDRSSFSLTIIRSLKPASLIHRRLILLFKCCDGDTSVVGSGWTSFSFVTGNLKVSCSKTLGTPTFTCSCTGHVYIVVFTSFLGLSFLGERTVQKHL